MKTISVAMATYCGEKYVEKQLASLLTQSRQADKVIICDDCSTDNTAQIVASFIDANCLGNWLFIRGDKNTGYRENFKKAVSMTDSDLIFLCDQDDYWHKDKLCKMEKVFEKNLQIKALNSSFGYIDKNGGTISLQNQKNKSNHNLLKRAVAQGALAQISFEELCTYNFSPGCTMAFTREIKDIYLANTASIPVHDWEINFIASLSGGCYFLNEELIDYRIHDNNAVGIPGMGANSSENRGSRSYRLNAAELMLRYTKAFESYSEYFNEKQNVYFQKQLAFLEARHKALGGKNPFAAAALYRYGANYNNSVTLKGRIADMACILR